MSEQMETQTERKPSKPFDPITSLTRHWVKITVFGSLLVLMLSPLVLLKKKDFYKADGKLLITPTVQTLIANSENNPIGPYNDYVRTQCERIKNEETLEAVLTQIPPELRRIFPSAKALGRKLKAELDYGTYFVTISLEGDHPDGLAEAINTIMTVFIDKNTADIEGKDSRRIKYLQEEKTILEEQISHLTKQFREVSRDIGTADFREAGNIYNKMLESLQVASVDAYTHRIQKENNLKAVIQEADAVRLLSIDADVEDFILNSDVASDMDIQTYRQIQVLKESLEGLSENNPDRKFIEDKISNLSESLDYSKDMLKRRTHQIMLSKRDAGLQEKIAIAKSELDAAKSAERELKARLNTVIGEKTTISNKILDGQQIEANLKKKQSLLTRVEDRINELRVEARTQGRISLERLATPPTDPAGSTLKKLIIVCFILGFGSVTFVCVLFDLTDKRIRSKKDILNAIGARVTWPISNYLLTRTEKTPFSTATRDDSSNVVSKAIHSLAIRLDRERRENNAKLAVFTGVDARSGTSEILINVAYAMTRLCKRVLVVDANLINPAFDRILLENSGAMGLVEHMREELDFAESIIYSAERQYDVLPAGQLLLMSEINLVDRSKFPPMFEALKENYDFILVDTPPVLVSDFTEFLILNADIVPLVVQGDRSKYDGLYMVGDIFHRLKIGAVAVVLNWGAPRERNLAQITISRILAPITSKLTTSPLWNPRHIYRALSRDDYRRKRTWLFILNIRKRIIYRVKNKKMVFFVVGLLFMGWYLLGKIGSNSLPLESIGSNSRLSVAIKNSVAEKASLATGSGHKSSCMELEKDSPKKSKASEAQDIVDMVERMIGNNTETLEHKEGDRKTIDNMLSTDSLVRIERNDGREKQLHETEIIINALKILKKDPTDIIDDHVSEEFILSLPASVYTIQLMGAENRSYLLNKAELCKISDEIICFQKKNGSSDWYVLIYKLFTDRSEAMACVEVLAPELRVNQPWVRRLGDIQKEILEKGVNAKAKI